MEIYWLTGTCAGAAGICRSFSREEQVVRHHLSCPPSAWLMGHLQEPILTLLLLWPAPLPLPHHSLQSFPVQPAHMAGTPPKWFPYNHTKWPAPARPHPWVSPTWGLGIVNPTHKHAHSRYNQISQASLPEIIPPHDHIHNSASIQCWEPGWGLDPPTSSPAGAVTKPFSQLHQREVWQTRVLSIVEPVIADSWTENQAHWPAQSSSQPLSHNRKVHAQMKYP